MPHYTRRYGQMPEDQTTPATPPTTPPADDTKTYSADYVKALREESKGYRQRATGTEKAIRTALGLKDDEELGDIEQRIKAKETSALQAANDRLIAAELKGLEGYDQKLLSKVIDLTSVKIDDKGTVSGLKEAAEAAAKEYPAVKTGTKQPFVPPNPAAGSGATNPNQAMNDLIRGKR
jgi:hypothetical protein